MSRIVALALAVGMLFTAQAVLTQLHSGRPVDVGPIVFAALLFLGLWALLTPVVLLSLRRWPLDTKPIYRPILLHASISLVIGVVQVMLALGVRSLVSYGNRRASSESRLDVT